MEYKSTISKRQMGKKGGMEKVLDFSSYMTVDFFSVFFGVLL